MAKINFKKVVTDKTNILLLLLNLLFFTYYVLLAFYSRPHYDDLHFLWKLKQMSIGEYVSDMYFSRSGRFVGYFLNGLVFKTILYFGESMNLFVNLAWVMAGILQKK